MRRVLPYNPDLGRLILRLGLAAVLLYHGIPKLMDVDAAVVAFQGMGLPEPAFIVAMVLLAEVSGGVLILLGVGVDIAGLLVIIDMLGAIYFVHWRNGFDFTKGGWEHPFTVLAMALALALAGPGRLTVWPTSYKGADRRRRD
jgi:putative oxidoreductase